MSMTMQKQHKGASAIGLIIGLAIIAVTVFIGIQYIPQYVESQTVGSILDYVGKRHKMSPFSDVNAVQRAIDKQLNVNEMIQLKDNFVVIQNGGSFTITVTYERELNLGYKKKPMTYVKNIKLN